MEFLTQFVDTMMQLVGELGYLGIFSSIGLEYACFPLPSEVILPFVGMSISQTSLNFLPSFIISIIAGLVGSYICYFLGYYGGKSLISKLSSKSKGLSRAMDLFNSWFDKYSRLVVLFSRVIPLTRTYISLFAGLNCMNLMEFTMYSLVGIALWNLVLMGLGFYLGQNWGLISSILNTYSTIIITILGVALILFVLRKILLRQKA